MDETMALSVVDVIIADLTALYSDQPTFNADKLAVIVNKVVDEVVLARNYRKVGYTDNQIMADLFNYKSNIYNLAEYDYSHFGAPHESSHSENSVSRTWGERSKLFKGIVAITPL